MWSKWLIEELKIEEGKIWQNKEGKSSDEGVKTIIEDEIGKYNGKFYVEGWRSGVIDKKGSSKYQLRLGR